jgi:PDZ domain
VRPKQVTKLRASSPVDLERTRAFCRGDVIVALDGAPTKGPGAAEALMQVTHKKEGATVKLTYVRNGETRTADVTVALRKNVMRNDPAWQQESKYPPTVGQMVFGGTAQVMANLALTERYPRDVLLNVSVANKSATAFNIDDAKFFVLDGTGQQLRHVSLDEIKYAIQLQVARNWRGGTIRPRPCLLHKNNTQSLVLKTEITR